MSYTDYSMDRYIMANVNARYGDRKRVQNWLNEDRDMLLLEMSAFHCDYIERSVQYWSEKDPSSGLDPVKLHSVRDELSALNSEDMNREEYLKKLRMLIGEFDDCEKRCKELCCADWNAHHQSVYRAINVVNYMNEMRYPFVSCSIRKDVMYQKRGVAVQYHLDPYHLVLMASNDAGSAKTDLITVIGDKKIPTFLIYPFATEHDSLTCVVGLNDVFYSAEDYKDALFKRITENACDTGEIILDSSAVPCGVYIKSTAREDEVKWAESYATVYNLPITYEKPTFCTSRML